MNILRSFVITIVACAAFLWAEEQTFQDPEGDAKFGERPVKAFDLRSVTFSAYQGGHLLITYQGWGPMSELGDIYSWFAVWVDLDKNHETGERHNENMGADLILGTESTRGGPWTGEANVRGPTGEEAPIELLDSWVKEDKAMSLYRSELFSRYPTFRVLMLSHHDGGFVDQISKREMYEVSVFKSPGKLQPVPDFFDYTYEGEPGEERVWRDSTGSFEITAALIKSEPSQVTLRLPDQSTREVPLDRISGEDKIYLKDFISNRAP